MRSFILWQWKINIIWCKFLLLLESIFSEFFRTNFNSRFLYSIEVGLNRFLNSTLEMLVEAHSKQSTFTLQLLLWPLQKQSTYICWRPLPKQSRYLQRLLGASLKQRVLTHYRWCWGPFESRVLTHDQLRSILYEWIISFSPNLRNLRAKHLEWGPWKWGAEVSASLVSLYTHHWL